MIFTALTAAAMLLGANSMPVSELRNNVELKPVVTEFINAKWMTVETRRILIEDYAAPYWNLTIDEAWYQYEAGHLKIHEIVPEVRYILEYDGITDILLSDED